MKDAVPNIEPKVFLPLTLVTESMNTDPWAINNNYAVSIELQTSLSSEFTASATIQASVDGMTWHDLTAMQASIAGDDQILWSMTELGSLQYLRVKITMGSGSALFYIIGRAT